MISTFMGLETAKRGLSTTQSALSTMSQNVANANTPGYTRQRVNMAQTAAFPSMGLNTPMVAGQIGTGVHAESVQRIRESFLDTQYRGQASKFGYYGSMSESLSKMEGIMNEPSQSGLQATMDKFWSSLQVLSVNTENSGARDVVAASGESVADTLNYYYNSLTSVQKDIGSQIEVTADRINSILDSIEKLNRQIGEVEPHGYLPNDLYDQRDILVDSLSELINIKVTNYKPENYGNSKGISEGLYSIEVINADGRSYNPPVNLVGKDIVGFNKVTVSFDTTNSGLVNGISFGGSALTEYSFTGKLAGMIESFGHVKGGVKSGYYPDMISNLNKMTEAFVNEFNAIHKEGFSLGGTTKSNLDFFKFDTKNGEAYNGNAAKWITVNSAILDNPALIAAGETSGASADNGNAKKLAGLKLVDFSKYTTLPANSKLNGNLDSFYSGIIGKMGVNSESSDKNYRNALTLATSVDTNRKSVSGVSLDEEMTDMIKFQHAYNASARNITMIDEMLDKIINGMGVVGR